MKSDLRALDWNLLRTFFVIIEERSLTRAAVRLQISQPSVTAALQRLEITLGLRLIVRASRRFELTRHGELLYGECAQIFRGVSRIGEKLSGAERDITGALRILAVTDVRYAPFDQALREVHLRYPSITVQIDTVSSPQAVRAISRQIAPLAICLLTQPIAGLTCEHLEREEFGVFCGTPHPFFAKEGCAVEHLRGESFVSFSCYNEGGALEPMLALGVGSGFGGRISGSSAHLPEVLRMVQAGIGIGILPVASVRRELDAGLLWCISPEGVQLGADLYLVTNPAMSLELAEVSFLSILREMIRADRLEP
ncbi:LysR family transcriptional regulator [Novosphingobium sp. UBA1939]|uniref:LysR family transcriptional regulator n=1 Tax=Novosphingobium sp. UBA1939 TaxID=1946982 RepID=UPI0025DCED40|nr:LysR family transcriptional regulator [Novosphingobium sp. UBA1939]